MVVGISRFEEIRAWQTARLLTRRTYALSGGGPCSRDFALRDQIRRAAISVMNNVAEDFESRTQALVVDDWGRAKSSLGEVRSQRHIGLDCGHVTEEVSGTVRTHGQGGAATVPVQISAD